MFLKILRKRKIYENIWKLYESKLYEFKNYMSRNYMSWNYMKCNYMNRNYMKCYWAYELYQSFIYSVAGVNKWELTKGKQWSLFRVFWYW